jgi:hypothetical protein
VTSATLPQSKWSPTIHPFFIQLSFGALTLSLFCMFL